ncbi:hypothetical protein D3C75_927130 [compost metagenome]
MVSDCVNRARAVGRRMSNGLIISVTAISFISLPSIFLPRNSGVRPTMSPDKNTAIIAYMSTLTNPAPTPPKTVFSIMFPIVISPPIGVSVSCIVLTAPVSDAVVTTEYRADWATPNLTSFPSIEPCWC